ncbi:hypothetical protein [Streptomyces lydicus]|uniref:hypothetical protein n=1 Tax=Streptomyces lydicus TaxID=47763 RepID=UPI0010115C61|nr:hypothetical protein [Streptomyces lydicus]MCZ1012352.1 hypothetical protein [Streptomyces lydicus]
MPYQPTVLMTAIDHSPEKSTGAAAVQRVSARPEQAALVDAVRTLYPLHHATSTRPPLKTSDLSEMHGQRVTMLFSNTGNLFNAPQLIAVQGRIVTHALTPLGLIHKGRRTRGTEITESNLVDAVPGWGDTAVNELRTRLAKTHALFPDTIAPLTAEVLDTIPPTNHSTDSPPVTTVLLTSTQLPGEERVHGCLRLITDRTPNPGDNAGDILNNVLITPPSYLTSEHGSIHTSQLPRNTAVLPTVTPLSLATALDLAHDINHQDPARSYLQALAALTPRP